MKYTLGIDAGSSYIKFVLIDSDHQVIAKKMISRQSDIDQSCTQCYAELLSERDISKEDVARVTATGYGRKQVSFADEVMTEITALATGAFHVDKQIRTIIDIGGQDSKVIAMNPSGKVLDFMMNQKCSAGTGKFLEVTSASLGVSVDQLGDLSIKSDKPLTLSSTCTVFAESEIISHIAQGQTKENIIKALHRSISAQIIGLYYQTSVAEEGNILFTGGVAQNQGIVEELSRMLRGRLIVPEHPQYVAALGAALYTKRKSKQTTGTV